MKTNKIYKSSLLVASFLGLILGLTSCKEHINIVGMSDYYYEDEENYQIGDANIDAKVENIDINWMGGNVTISTHELTTILISENSDIELNEEMKLRYWVDDLTLRVKFLACGKWDLSSIEKNLVIYVPSTLAISNLKISTLSANMSLSSLSILESLKTNTLSGELEASLVSPLNEFEGSSTSGSSSLKAPSVTSFVNETLSGETTVTVNKEPDKLDIDSTSGRANLNLPKSASFTLDYSTNSGSLSSELSYNKTNGKYVFNEGKGEYEIVTVSGDVCIKESK